MTDTEPRPDILVRVRVHDELAGDEAGLLAYSVRERIEAVVEGATRRWGVDPGAVTVELVPPPRLLLRRLSDEELAEQREAIRQRLAALPDGHMTLDFGGTVGSLAGVPIADVEQMSALKQRWLKVYSRPLVDPRGMVQARPPWWRRWFRRD